MDRMARIAIGTGMAALMTVVGTHAAAGCWAARTTTELLADADLVVAGTARSTPVSLEGGLECMRLQIDETLMGPAREAVTLAFPLDRGVSATLRFEDGQDGIWILRRGAYAQAPEAYSAFHPSCLQPVGNRDEVVREVAAFRARNVQFRLAENRSRSEIDLRHLFPAEGEGERRRIIPSLGIRMRNLTDAAWTFRTCEYLSLQNYVSIEVDGPGGFRATRDLSLFEPMVVHEHRETRVEPWVWTDFRMEQLQDLLGHEAGAYTLHLRLHREDGSVIGEGTLVVNAVRPE
jgi:hypothetical protein